MFGFNAAALFGDQFNIWNILAVFAIGLILSISIFFTVESIVKQLNKHTAQLIKIRKNSAPMGRYKYAKKREYFHG